MLVKVDWPSVAAGIPRGHLLKVRPEVAARIWADPDDAQFAEHFGIPYCRGLFQMYAAVGVADPDNPRGSSVVGPEFVPHDSPHGKLMPLGDLYGGTLYAHAAEGGIWVEDPESETEYELIHADLSSLSYMLYLLEAERPLPESDPHTRDWIAAEERIRAKITHWDEIPCAEAEGFWGRFFESYLMY